MAEDNPQAQDPQPNQDQQWVKEVARQSWEPELLISGAAAYASLSLPGLFKSAFVAYRMDFMVGSSKIDLLFPTLIYAVFASIGQILILTFFLHFAMRAFWVGMVGLLSVYPQGIRFSEIKYVSDYGKTFLKKKLTTVDEFVIRLDKWCSILFSVAFIGVTGSGPDVCLLFCSDGIRKTTGSQRIDQVLHGLNLFSDGGYLYYFCPGGIYSKKN